MSDFDKRVEGGLVGYLIAKAMEPEPAPAPAPIIINHYIEVPVAAPVQVDDDYDEFERHVARLEARTPEEVRAEEWRPFQPDRWPYTSHNNKGEYLYPRFGRQFSGEERKEYLFYLPELQWYTICMDTPVVRAGPGWVLVRDDPEYGYVMSIALGPETLGRLCNKPVPPAKARRKFSPWGYGKPAFIPEDKLAPDAYWSKLAQRMRYRVDHPLAISEAVAKVVTTSAKPVSNNIVLEPQAWTFPEPGEDKDEDLAEEMAEELAHFNAMTLAEQKQEQNGLLYWSPVPFGKTSELMVVCDSEFYQEDPNDQQVAPDVADLLLSQPWFADSGFIAPPTTELPRKPVIEVAVVAPPQPVANPVWNPEEHFGLPPYQKPNMWRRFQNMMAGREDVEY